MALCKTPNLEPACKRFRLGVLTSSSSPAACAAHPDRNRIASASPNPRHQRDVAPPARATRVCTRIAMPVVGCLVASDGLSSWQIRSRAWPPQPL